MNIHIRHIQGKGAVADQAALEQFQQQWATYQKLVDSDCAQPQRGRRALAPLAHGAAEAVCLSRHCLRRLPAK